jgi:Domain of unknown function (DUF6379)
MGPLDKDVVRPDGLTAADGKLQLQLRSHWYRSLPLSSLAVVDVAIDGEPVPAEKLTFRYDGRSYTFDQLPEQYDEWWYITDPVTIEIPHDGATAGSEHRVHVDLGLSIPYIIVGPPQARTPLLAASVTDKTLVCN